MLNSWFTSVPLACLKNFDTNGYFEALFTNGHNHLKTIEVAILYVIIVSEHVLYKRLLEKLSFLAL